MPIPLSRRALLTGIGLALAGCAGKRGASSATARVVSLSPSTTEAVFAIGAGSVLVGRSRFCDHPPEALALPPIGGYSDPSVEAIIALAPTLVVGARGPAGPGLEARLAAQGIATYFPETESFAQILELVDGLGARLSREAEAKAVRARIEADRAAVAAAASGKRAPRAVMLFDAGPIVVAGPGSFPDEMMRLAGAQNLVTEGGAYPTIGLERLVALDPEVILDGATAGTPGPSPLDARRDAPGWRSLAAIAGRRTPVLSSVVLRPGPRIGEGLRELARAVHGAEIELK